MKNFLNVFNKASENNILVDELIAANSTDWFLNEVLEVSDETYSEYFNKLADTIRKCYLDTELSINDIENNIYECIFGTSNNKNIESATESKKIEMIDYVISELGKMRNNDTDIDEIMRKINTY